MHERFNRTSICSVAFFDIINYSKKPGAEQVEVKKHFNRILSEAIKDVAQNDRIIIDTGDGAAIALLGAPEEALFISLTIRDAISDLHKSGIQGLRVRTGINLGPVQVVKDINDQPNIIGDGINVAQQVMNFAEAGQILVSRSYYEVTSRLTQEIMQMFTYFGLKQDKHVRDHEVYVVRPLPHELAADRQGPVADTPVQAVTGQRLAGKKLEIVLLAVLVLLLAVLLLGRNEITPVTAVNTPQQKPAVQAEKAEKIDKPDQSGKAHKKEANKSVLDKISQSIKQGEKPKHCTQAEIALGRCN